MIDASKILTFANNLEDKHEGKGYKWLYDKLRYEIIKQNQAELNNNEVLDLVSKLLTVGTEVEITKDINGHGFDIGEIVEIVDIDPTDDGDISVGEDLPYLVESRDSINGSWISSTECNVC